MLELKVETLGDRTVVVLTEDALRALGVAAGDTLRLEPAGNGAHEATRDVWHEDPHARGRAFLRRYNRAFGQLEG